MRIIIAGVICLLASSLSASDLFDVVQSLREQAWESEYIPESTVPAVPFTDYENFEVVELFRAETIEELEASLTDGYPFAWLEETLKDESIPWEDRYWLDCRMRAAISQNLHVFYDTENNPVHVDADDVFPGEWYWREHMIVDPEGRYASEDAVRPVLPEWGNNDAGYILSRFGYRIGEIAVAYNGMSLSRDASIGVLSIGQPSSYDDFEEWNVQYYANLLYPDGSFQAIQFDELGVHSGSVSADGSTLVFFHKTRHDEEPGSVTVMDRNGTILRTIPSEFHFSRMFKPPISSDGHYASCELRDPERHCAIVDCVNGEVFLDTEHTGTDLNSIYSSFSPDANFLCIVGKCKGRILDLQNGSMHEFSETSYTANTNEEIRISCSNLMIIKAIMVIRNLHSNELSVYREGSLIHAIQIDTDAAAFLVPEVSPNGFYTLMNPASFGKGGCLARIHHSFCV